MNICVLRSGGEYNADHVRRLAKQVPHLVCLTDIEIDGIETIPLWYDWHGWWAKIELFRPDIHHDLMYFDLDTTVIKMPNLPSETTLLSDFGMRHVVASGMMFIKHDDKAVIWDNFIKDPIKNMQDGITYPKGDGGFIDKYFRNKKRWQSICKVYSYKLHCKKGIPDDAEVICYHGKPRPWDL